MMAEAMAAARAGDRGRARELLARMLRSDSANAEIWVWMSSVVDTDRERVYCLESALNIDPTNRAALRGLVILGARKPEEAPRQKAKMPRRRVVPVTKTAAKPRLRFNWRMVGGVMLAIVALSMLGGVYLWLRNFPVSTVVAPTLSPPSSTPTATPEIPTVTLTPIPAETRTFRTPIPTELASTPIAFFVEATPTPTPILGLTPRPSYEAYGAGIAALQREDYETAINFFQQVIDLDSTLADAYYFLGEAHRLSGTPGQAVLAYDRATLVNNDFAPSFVGRGLARIDLTLRENSELKAADLPPDFDSAINRDPMLTVAYLEKANFYANLRLWKTMEETLQAAIDAGVREPIVYIRMSLAQYQRANYIASLESATEGSAGDPTNLEGYKAIGRANIALRQYEPALWPLQTYIAYEPEDHTGWGYYSRTLVGLDRIDEAMAAANQSLSINDRYAPAYLARALAKLETGDYESAFTDLEQARRYGSENYDLTVAFGRAHSALREYTDALPYFNQAIAEAPGPIRLAEGYALRALIYEVNPDLTSEAILNWRWILETEGADPETVEMAEIHLAALTGEGPTLTPVPTTATPSPLTPTPTGTATP
jgi:tetratricopeptide (TPR) repeat protein